MTPRQTFVAFHFFFPFRRGKRAVTLGVSATE